MPRSVAEIIELVAARAEDMGMDLSSEDVGFLLSLFFLGMAGNGILPTDLWLHNMSDECGSVRNEAHDQNN